jgi:hypothetical protein
MNPEQFAYFERRLNMIEARLVALEVCIVTMLPKWEQCPFSREALTELIETTRAQTEAKLSEFPSPHAHSPPEPPDSMSL